jgi:DNA-binding LytR/AlgR family response regulator
MRPARDGELEPPSIASDATGSGTSEVILVKSGFRQVAIRVGEILFVEAARNYVRIHLENGKVIKTRIPIDRLGQHLGSHRFLRIHRGRLVSMERIRSVRSLAGGRLQLTLSQGATIIVARDRRRAVLAEIGLSGERRR